MSNAHQPTALAAIILAGGRSRRMGHDKRRLRLWGDHRPTLLEQIVGVAATVSSEVIVVLNDPADWPDLAATCVPDQIADAGPLGGLSSGLSAVHTEAAFLLACDMPNITTEFLHFLASCMQPDVQALVPLRPLAAETPDQQSPRNQANAEPLLAIYHTSCLPMVRSCLAQGNLRMTDLLDRIAVRYLTPPEWQPYDPAGLLFHNLNRPADLTALKLPRQ
ncbi:MAG: molybdenum cofactor guanylyltransferase [Roseiflexaceae bacterium]